jgi:hypothetical protein
VFNHENLWGCYMACVELGTASWCLNTLGHPFNYVAQNGVTAAVTRASKPSHSACTAYKTYQQTFITILSVGPGVRVSGGWSGNLSESAGTVRYSHVVTTVDRGKYGLMYRSIECNLHWTPESHRRGCGAELGSFGPKTGPVNFAPGLSGAQHGSAED